MSEIDLEFAERRRRAYYFNYPRAVAQRITQYLFSVEPRRSRARRDLVEDFDRAGHRAGEVMRQVSTLLNIFGCAYLEVDAPCFDGVPDLERAGREKLRPFARALSPLQLTDWSYDAEHQLQWAIIQEDCFCNDDPWRDGQAIRRLKLLRRDSWQVWEQPNGGAPRLLAEGVNPLGKVPLIFVCEVDGPGISGGHWFNDVVRISEAILNNESEAQMNVVKQMFGMLVVSDAFFNGIRQHGSTGDAGPELAATVARSAAIIESPEEKGISRYISPGGVPSEVIRRENESLKRELYDVVGLAVQSQSRSAQTAESKQWDFQNICQFLSGRAALLEQAETAVWQLFHLWDDGIAIPQITYNRKFAIRDLAGAISGLVQLSNLDAGPEFAASIRRIATELLETLASSEGSGVSN